MGERNETNFITCICIQAKDRGNLAFKERRFQEAIDAYTEALDIGGSDHILFSNRSGAFASSGNFQKAKEDAEACTSMRPQWAKGWSRLGAAEIGLGNLAAAEVAFQTGLSLEPDNDGLKAGMADLRQRKSQPKPTPSTTSSHKPGSIAPKDLLTGTVSFLCNVGVLLCSIGFVIPSEGSTQWKFYGNAMLASLAASVLGLVTTYGMPSFSTVTKIWKIFRRQQSADNELFQILTSIQLHYILYSSLFLTATPSLVYLLPVLMLSIFSACRYLESVTSRYLTSMHAALSPILKKVTTRWNDIDRTLANLEVIIFFFQIFQIFTPHRNILTLILYAHAFLRIRYMSNDQSKAAWAKVRRNTDKLFKHPSCPPFLTSLYDRMITFAVGLVNPQPPQ